MTSAITIQSQVTTLQANIRETMETFFASLPEMECSVSLSTALVEQSKKITVFQRDKSGAIAVSDPKAYVEASEQSQAMKSVVDEIEKQMDPFISQLFKAHRAATAIRTQYTADANAEILRLKKEREAFFAEEERLRREATIKAQEEARKAEEARLLAEAAAAQADGDTATAEAIFEEAITVEAPPVVLQSTVPTVAGTSFRTVTKFEVLDPTKLNPEFIRVDEVAIGKVVRSMKKAAETLCGKPGAIRVWEEKSIIG